MARIDANARASGRKHQSPRVYVATVTSPLELSGLQRFSLWPGLLEMTNDAF